MASSDLPASISNGSFNHLRSYVSFIGYPRSGHSLIGALLDAHPNAIVSDEQNSLEYYHSLKPAISRNGLFQVLLNASVKKMQSGRTKGGLNQGKYSYQLPGQFQGKFTQLTCIGDKYGDSIARSWARDPSIVKEFYAWLQMPVTVIHVMRNPFDNISTLTLRSGSPKDVLQQISIYRKLVEAVSGFREWVFASSEIPINLIEFTHEEFVLNPRRYLVQIAEALQLEPEENWLQACLGLVKPQPNESRTRLQWTQDITDQVKAIIASKPFLNVYQR